MKKIDVTKPAIAVSGSDIVNDSIKFETGTDKSFTLANGGGNTLNWQIAVTPPSSWLSITETGGSYNSVSISGSSGSAKTILVRVDTNKLIVGTNSGKLTISATGVTSKELIVTATKISSTPTTGTITGMVVDSVNNTSGLSGVTVIAKGSFDGQTYLASPAMTDGAGNYSIPNLPIIQTYSVTASINGRNPNTIQNVSVPKSGLIIGLAQLGSISGYVLAQLSGGPVAGATVKLTPSNKTTTTNSSGYYKLENVVQGNNYTLSVTTQADSFIQKTSNIISVTNSNLNPTADTLKLQWNAPTSGLQAYFPFDGNANDITGHISSDNITVGSNISLSEYDRWNHLSAVYFNPSNTGIKINSGFNITTAWTFSCWVYILDFPTTAQADAPFVFLTNATTSSTPHTIMGLVTSQVASPAYWGASSTDASANTILNIQLHNTLPVTNKWIHVVFTCDQNKVTHFYVNGSDIIETPTINPGTLFTPTKCYIGAEHVNPTDSFNYHFYGRMDRLRIYNTALTSEQVMRLYKER